MKVRLLLISLVVLFALASCSKSDYLNVIPAEATFVASVDIKEVADKADLASSPYLKLVKDNIGLVASGKQKKDMMEVIDDPQKMGLDLSVPFYVFETPNHCFGATFKIGDKDDLEDFLALMKKSEMCSKLTEQNDIKYASLLGDVNLAFNDNALVMLVGSGEVNAGMVKRTLTSLFAIDEENSFASTPNYDRLQELTGDIKMYSNMAALPKSVTDNMKSFIPKGARMSDVELTAAVGFEDGRISFKSEMYSNNANVQKMFDEASSQFGKINGGYLNVPNDDFLIWASANVKGKWLIDNAKKSEEVKQLIFVAERGIDIQKMLGSVDGDIAVVIPNSGMMSDKKDFCMISHVVNTDFMNDINYWKSSMSEYGATMTSAGDGAYHIKSSEYDMYWGLKENDLYFATEHSLPMCKTRDKDNAMLKAKEAEIKNSCVYMYVNLQSLPKDMLAGMGSPQISGLVGNLESLTLQMKDANSYEIALNLKDKSGNVLKQLLK